VSRGSLTLREQVGRLLIVGLAGPELTSLERAWLRLLRPSGVILFRRNIETPAQSFALLAEVSSVVGDAIFRCVDVEGGLVDRLRDSVAPMPSAAAVAATGKRRLFRKHGVLIGLELRALGLNTTLAPVLDLALPISQAVMRTRATSADPERVVAYGEEFLAGLKSQQVLGCGKHFPGLGGGNLDSHQATPVIERAWDEMWSRDLLPYRRLAKKLPLVMVSHAAYPVAAGDRRPASISSFWIGEVLQRRARFGGLVLSDDMEMGGILSQVAIEEAAVEAVRAGTHLIEVCKDSTLVLRVYEALLREAERSAAFRRTVEGAARNVSAARRKLIPEPAGKCASAEQLRRLLAAIAELAAKAPEPSQGT
jgi:beta-N-acetylhexosaminidase